MDADVVVVGAGQAGLAASRELNAAGVPHVVLERGRVAETWRNRWDSFCLVTPNWSIRLPDWEPVPDPDGFLPRDDLVAAFERYAAGLHGAGAGGHGRHGDRAAARRRLPPRDLARRAGAPAASCSPRARSPGRTARRRRPGCPTTCSRSTPRTIARRTSSRPAACWWSAAARRAASSPRSCTAPGRDVVLACGKSPWVHRRIAGRDIVWWLLESGFLDVTVEQLASPLARFAANVQATGRDGGHDLTYRELHAMGVTLAGRLDAVADHAVRFAPDLAESVAWGDARHGDVMGFVRRLAEERGIGLEDATPPEPFAPPAPEELDLRGTGAVIFTCGYRPDQAAWVRAGDAFDALGFPLHRDGASTAAAGLYFVGVHFMRTRKSGLLCGVHEDAALVAGRRGRSLGRGELSGLDRHVRHRALDRHGDDEGVVAADPPHRVDHGLRLVVAEHALDPRLGAHVALELGAAVAAGHRRLGRGAARVAHRERDEPHLQQVLPDRLELLRVDVGHDHLHAQSPF